MHAWVYKGAPCGITVELITSVQTEDYRRSIAKCSGLICNMRQPEASLHLLPSFNRYSYDSTHSKFVCRKSMCSP